MCTNVCVSDISGTVFVGCTSKELLMQDCDDMEVVSVTNCAAVVDSHNSNMFLACRQRSTCRGDYSGLFFAPYNTYVIILFRVSCLFSRLLFFYLINLNKLFYVLSSSWNTYSHGRFGKNSR